MALSRQRAVFASILGLSLVGLAVDRFVLDGGPGTPPSELLVAPAEAAAKAVGALLGSATSSPAPAAPAVSREAAAIADLAKTLRGLGVDQDVLASLPESFGHEPPPVAAAVVEAPAPVQVGEPPLVTAVLSGSTPRAIVGGKPVRVGSTVEGWQVVHVGAGRVVFERDGVRAERNVSRVPALASLAPE